MAIDYQQHETLRLLASRINKVNCSTWIRSEGFGGSFYYDHCLICGHKIHFLDIEKHAILHLKEYGLLIFS